MRKLRVAKYKRVSTKEQAIKGFSIQAQDEILDDFIEKQGFILVGDYVDEGISASTLNRPGLQELLADVREGKIDLIIFTKLDRWFRSVAHYYKIQEILDDHNVVWRTILEDYNTETSDGKFKVNIMLSVAQQELDRTSERIKVVFESKVKNKQAITSALPLGYTIGTVDGTKRVVKDKTKEEIVLDIFSYFEIHQSVRGTMTFINDKYDMHLSYMSFRRMLSNKLYVGEFHGVVDYCASYLTRERFNKIQMIIEQGKVVKQYKHSYLFSGMFRCHKCGGTMSGNVSKNERYDRLYYYYRCNRAHTNAQCDNIARIRESDVEEYLLRCIEDKLEEHLINAEIDNAPVQKPKYNRSKIQAEIDRLNKMYQKGRIDDDEYDEQYNKLQKKLSLCDIQPQKRDLEPLRKFLASDFKTIYDSLEREERRSLWRSIIDRMVAHDDDIEIHFV